MVRAIWSSVANVVVAPLQDLLGLGTEGRMNFPGKPAGNWTWRMPADAASVDLCDNLLELNTLYSRKLSK
jgi:4-alpha-glucanotransferase